MATVYQVFLLTSGGNGNASMRKAMKVRWVYLTFLSCEEGRPAEWAIIELQGDLESRGEGTFCSQFIGDLHFTKNNVPVLIVGHHILYGKEVKMEKPFAVLEKHILDTESHNDAVAVDDFHAEYIVKAVIKKKLLFKTRPKPIIANVPKIV